MSLRPNHALTMTMMRRYQDQAVFTTIELRSVYAHSRSLQTCGINWGTNLASQQFSDSHAGGKTILRLVSWARTRRITGLIML